MSMFISIKSTRIRFLAIWIFITLFLGQCQSQFRMPNVEITESDTVNYAFLHDDANIIENAGILVPLFSKMLAQRTSGGKKVNIVHIGDSHIQGNLLTQEVRDRLQREFGDAGRGFIFPYKLARSSNPKDYLVETNCRWTGSNCQRDLSPETPFGVAGFKISTINSAGEMTFRMKDSVTAETKLFTKVTVFHRKNDGEFDIEVKDEVSNQEAQLFIEDDYAHSYYFDRPVGQVTIAAKKTSEKQKSLTIDGVCLENELSGVLYHSIGVNGAKFTDFARAKYFAAQVADLNPDLVILSFGTNEGQGHTNKGYMRQTMSELIENISDHCPGVLFMLTTPADSYLRGKGFNPYLNEMSEVIKEFARENGYALWDLHNVGGGQNSAINWKSNGLMSSDSVHYSKAGYAVQGKLLFQSIIKSYNDFVGSGTLEESHK